MQSETSLRPEKQEVHCSACSRLVTITDGDSEGSVISCPFCHSKMRLKLMTVYVAEPLVEA